MRCQHLLAEASVLQGTHALANEHENMKSTIMRCPPDYVTQRPATTDVTRFCAS